MPNWFPTLSVDGYDCILLLPEINWRTAPRFIHTLEDENTEGRTGIEARASTHPEVRLALNYLYRFPNDQAAAFCAMIESLDPEARLLVPLWPDSLLTADYAAQKIWSPQHWLNFNPDTGEYSLDADGGFPLSIGLAMCAPVSLPSRKPITDLDCDVTLSVEEDSPWEARIDIHTLAQAAWTFDADWATPPDDTSRWQQKRDRIGRGRITSRTGNDAPVKRGQAAGYTFASRENIRRALTFWRDHAGPRDPFTAPQYFRPGWNGVDADSPELQVHFAEDTFSLDFAQPGEARARLSFDQDLLLVEGEPAQARPSRAYLFKVWWEGSSTTMAWTDWPQTYTHDDIDYLNRPIELQEMQETLIAGDTEWKITVADFEGNPLRAFGRLERERRLLVEIRECDPAIADTAALVFSGEIKKATNKGPLFTATAAIFGGVLKYLIPSCTVQQGCNNTLGDILCGIDIETLKATGTIAALNGTVVDVTTANAAAADAWALGYALFGTGDVVEVRYILHSAPITGGQRLTVHRPLWAGVAGTAVTMYPGCDQQYEGGCARHGNQRKFFGAPYKPEFLETIDSGYRAKTGK